MALDYDHVTSGNITPIKNHVLVTEMEQEGEKMVNGILRLSDRGNDRGIKARWAKIEKIGPEQTDVSVGQWVLVAHGRWTRGVLAGDGKVYRKIDNDEILLVSDDKPEGID